MKGITVTKPETEKAWLLKKAADTMGYASVDDMLKHEVTDSVATGICTEKGCHFVTSSIEPDSEDGMCDECGKNAIKSVFVLAGLI